MLWEATPLEVQQQQQQKKKSASVYQTHCGLSGLTGLFQSRHLTSTKSTGVSNNIHDSSVLFKLPSKPCQRDSESMPTCMHNPRTLRLNRIQPLLVLLFMAVPPHPLHAWSAFYSSLGRCWQKQWNLLYREAVTECQYITWILRKIADHTSKMVSGTMKILIITEPPFKSSLKSQETQLGGYMVEIMVIDLFMSLYWGVLCFLNAINSVLCWITGRVITSLVCSKWDIWESKSVVIVLQNVL